jgi:hypothetical protein
MVLQQRMERVSNRRSPQGSAVEGVGQENVQCGQRDQNHIENGEEEECRKQRAYKITFVRCECEWDHPNPFLFPAVVEEGYPFSAHEPSSGT